MAEEGDSGERSQEPTQKKLDDARKKGDVPKSMEVNNWFLLSAGAIALIMFSSDSAGQLTAGLKGFISNAGTISVDGGTLFRVLFLAAFLLFCLTFVVNTVAEVVRLKLRQRYRYL